jgi:hypothetical protein
MNGVWDISNNSFLKPINSNNLNNSNEENIETSNIKNENEILSPLKEENKINDITLKKYNKRAFSNNYFRTLNKKVGKSYNILTGYYDDENNIFVNHNSEAIKMEITMQKRDLGYKKYKFNGITVVQNLKDYLPKDISKEEIKEMIYNAFGEGLVDDAKYFIPGKTVTRKQANDIVDLVENYIKNDSIVENLNKDFLNGVNIIIDLVDLNKNIIKEKMFKGKNPSDRELENIFKNLSQGYTNVKMLSIEFQ